MNLEKPAVSSELAMTAQDGIVRFCVGAWRAFRTTDSHDTTNR
jgi:hypothetical protein